MTGTVIQKTEIFNFLGATIPDAAATGSGLCAPRRRRRQSLPLTREFLAKARRDKPVFQMVGGSAPQGPQHGGQGQWASYGGQSTVPVHTSQFLVSQLIYHF